MIALVLIVGLLVVGGFAYLNYVAAKKRRETFAAYAARRGWAWSERDDRWAERWDGEPFGRGHDRRASNVLTGTHDRRPSVAFDYRYSTTETTTVNGRTQTRTVHHPYSVIGIDTGARFPTLSVSPENFFGRALGRVLGNDVELESEDFNRAFTVHCDDRKFASDVLHPRMMERLMRTPELAWRLQDGWLLTFHQGSHELTELDAKLAVLDGIVDDVPDFVWRTALGDVPPAQRPETPRVDP